MAVYPTLTIADLVRVTGRPEADFNASFVTEALAQATLLFKIGTCLAAFPDDEVDAAEATYGILFMADAIEGAQPFQKILRNPFSSETIGAYSYAKLRTAVSAGLPTGVSWFDLAVSHLSVCDEVQGIVYSGGYNVFEENKVAHDGYGVYLGPADRDGDHGGNVEFYGDED